MARQQAVPREDPDELLRRASVAWSEKSRWDALLRDAFELSMPNRNGFTPAGPGAKKMDRVFDSTAVASAMAFANRFQSDVIPPFKKWIKLVPGPLVKEGPQREALAAALDEITDRMFAYIHASNFDTAANETLLDLGVGTGCMLVLEGDAMRPLNFIPVSISQIALEPGPWGGVGAVFRKHKLRVGLVKRQWKDATNFPAEWAELARTKPETEVDLCEATYFRDYGDGSANFAYCYDVIDEKSKNRLVERTYRLNPWVTPRWSVLPGETLGRGPVVQALPDIKTLNKIVELILRNLALYVSGVYTAVDDGVLNPNTAKLVPGSMIAVASNGGPRGPSLQALERSGSFDLASIEVEKLQMSIKRTMFDRQLPPDSGPVRSATEFIERVKELARDVGSPFGRFFTEFIVPVVQNVLQIMARRGFIPVEVPVDGLSIQVQVISPLAQEQAMAEVENVVRWLSILGALGKELVMISAKTESVGEWIGEKLGVPAKVRRSETERKSLLSDIKAMQAQQIAGDATKGAQVLPIGTGVPFQQVQTAGAAAGVQPFARAA